MTLHLTSFPSVLRRPAPAAAPATVRVEWAQSEDDVRAAQRLRYQVFAVERGARLQRRVLDVDRFDAFCDHLLVRVVGGGDDGDVVGTYRVLSPDRARAAGGCYSETEFDLAALAPLRPRAVELGRSCVRPDWRTGGVILAMWSALAQYMVRRDLDSMFGCTSISVAGGLAPVAALCRQLHRTHGADPRWSVQPLRPLPVLAAADGVPSAPPPLLKGYLRCGARVLGAPAYDQAFGTADVPMLLRLEDMAPRYRRHLLERQ